ncbi:MAG: kelch repeat-containing protein [Candidatus Dormiibacterota bacterium]
MAGAVLMTACGGSTALKASPSPGPSATQHASRPEARNYATLVYDPIHKDLLLIGGQDASAGLVPSVWSFDAGSQKWHYIGTLPAGVEPSDGAAFDVAAGKVIVHASWLFYSSKALVSETWAFDPVTGAWENRHPVQSPPPGICGCGSQMAYDEKAQKVVMFGGVNVQTMKETSDTWTYDYVSNLWTKMPLPLDASRLPSARNSDGFTYDNSADRIILFGGDADSGPAQGTWAYDYNTNSWANLKPATSPQSRSYGDLAYDKGADKVVLFGGLMGDSGVVTAETWTYDFKANDWELKAPSTSPSARGWQAMAFSQDANAVVIFGGGVDRNSPTDETWLYRTATDEWSQMTQAGS